MRRFLSQAIGLLAGVIFLPTVAEAQTWEKLHTSSRYDAYYDFSSVARSGDGASLTYLSDLKVRHVYASAVSQAEFDCEKKLMRITSTREYSERMGRGGFKQVISQPLPWDPVTDGTIAALLMKTACGSPNPNKQVKQSVVPPATISLDVMPSRSYDPIVQSNAMLRSLYHLKEASSWVDISYRFFQPTTNGESQDAIVARMTGKAPIDASLLYEGRVHKNLKALLAAKLASRFSIKSVDWKEAPYNFKLTVHINQSLDLHGKNMFEVLATLEPQEFSTSNSGLQGFMNISPYMAQTFAQSKEGIEGKIYEALEKSLDGFGSALKEAQMYCEHSTCAVPTGSMRTFTR